MISGAVTTNSNYHDQGNATISTIINLICDLFTLKICFNLTFAQNQHYRESDSY